MRLKINILFLFMLAFPVLFAQKVSSVSFFQEDKDVVVTYSLDISADVCLQVSTDGGKTYSEPLQYVSGDVGKNVQPGNNRIVWDALAEYEQLVGERIVFQVTADGRSIHNGHEYVDLGLPSGTLWATCNVGATHPEDYGDHFAWGATYTGGRSYASAPLYSEYTNRYFKYVTSGKFVDNKTVLDSTDDAATVRWGGDWHTPTKEQFDELRKRCKWGWTEKNGVKGAHIVSKKNGNSIFLPAAGEYHGLESFGVRNWGKYWTSSLYTKYNHDAYHIRVDIFEENKIEHGPRYQGLSVRPVCKLKQD